MDYVARISPLFLFCAFLYTFSIVMGFYLADDLDPSALQDLADTFPEPGSLGAIGYFTFIVINNLGKSLVIMMLGIIFSIPPVLFVVLNGFILGWLAYSVSIQTSIGFVTLAIIPHGIIEIPAILLCMSMGMGLGYQTINRLRGRPGLGQEWKEAWWMYVWRIAPLLVLAALLEVTLTPMILEIIG